MFRIFKVHRAGRTFYAATVRGVYLERVSREALLEAIKIREGFANVASALDI